MQGADPEIQLYLDRVVSTLRDYPRYGNSVAAFQGARWGGLTINAGQITERWLEIAIPPGVTSEQGSAMASAWHYAQRQGVSVTYGTVVQ
jgi:hypothetical protein